MNRLFGTDGMRSVAGQFPLDYSSVFKLGKGLVALLKDQGLAPKILIGRDSRESGGWLNDALFQGIKEASGEAVSLGVIPTPAVSHLTNKHVFSAGIVISASHNPFQDNGIKIFSSQGTKISEDWESTLEIAIRSSKNSSTQEVSEATPDKKLIKEYKDFLLSQFADIRMQKQYKIVIDCANGASSFYAPEIFSDLGFKVIPINASPNGKNINFNCGSLHPEVLAETVKDFGADIGVAYDGDADRNLCVDEKGTILNGDHTLYVCAKYLKESGRLRSDTVVATTMSNIGLETALQKMDLNLVRTQVGDKYVLDRMMELKANLGGERSGHTIFLDDCPSGDGILTSLKMCEVMVTKNTPLSQLISDYKESPQILLNVKVVKKEDFNHFPEILATMGRIEDNLGQEGRIDLRFSGTEPLARIMIEGKDEHQIQTEAKNMAEVILKYLG
ncbi:MAG: phosphoglucosamine mutase [Candidatus Aminicenantes bacterium]|nr:phosphoglucosamine mutase [Candidatus Aminicenantes bacterium]